MYQYKKDLQQLATKECPYYNNKNNKCDSEKVCYFYCDKWDNEVCVYMYDFILPSYPKLQYDIGEIIL